jgi:hypothetical protein
MKPRAKSSGGKKTLLSKRPKGSIAHKALDERDSTKRRSSPRKNNERHDVVVSESETKNNDTYESNDSSFDKEGSEGGFSGLRNILGKQRTSPRKHKPVEFSDDSEDESEILNMSEIIDKLNSSKPLSSDRESESIDGEITSKVSIFVHLTMSSSSSIYHKYYKNMFPYTPQSTRNEEDGDDAPVYRLHNVLVPLEDIRVLLELYLKEELTKDWTFSIKRVRSVIFFIFVIELKVMSFAGSSKLEYRT